MKKIISLLLVFTFGLSSCEKDDICDPDTPTTPRLVFTFYKINSPSELQNVTDLMVIGEDEKAGIIFNETATDTTKYLANGSTISIPLKTNALSTTYTFVLDSQNDNPAAINTDAIKFNYTHNDVYVSRACGFKTTFTLDPLSTSPPLSVPFVQTDTDGNGLWMQEVFVINPNIENENETHIKVFF